MRYNLTADAGCKNTSQHKEHPSNVSEWTEGGRVESGGDNKWKKYFIHAIRETREEMRGKENRGEERKIAEKRGGEHRRGEKRRRREERRMKRGEGRGGGSYIIPQHVLKMYFRFL